ncbi:hypothetical protein BC827DRAFT_1206007 [Russula dissimulans]|nr:hypothetical protein BC827DRAFT_1206007 [Russula dissimulans]
MAAGKNDWIIEDSEEEDQLRSPELDARRSASPVLPEGAISSIKSFASIPAEKTSHISSVGTDPLAKSTITSFPTPPHIDLSTISRSSSKSGTKPRPRPVFSRTSAGPSANASVSDPILPHTPTSDHRNPQLTIMTHSDPTVVENATGVTDPILNDFSPDIAERAKMRTRKATKRTAQDEEEVINITDDELSTTPVRKPKQRPKPRPVKRVIPAGNDPPLPSDPVTIPLLSSSPRLPPSDPFPASTLINSTPQPDAPDENAAPDPLPPESPIQPRKRKRIGRLQSPTDDLPSPNFPPAVLPPPEGDLDATNAKDLGRTRNSDKDGEDEYDVKKTPKKIKGSKDAEKVNDSAITGLGNKGADKSMQTVVEVVITSPRRAGSKKVKASKGRKPVKDEGIHASEQTSDDEDELILAPKRQRSSTARSHKGKQKAGDPRSENDKALSEIGPGSEQIAGEEEGPVEDEHHAKRASSSSASVNPRPRPRSRATNAETQAPPQEDPRPSVSAKEGDAAKLSPTRETPAPGKLRYTLSRFEQKTPMRELIRRASSHPNALFSMHSSPIASPLAKTSKSALRRIAPLHTTRRTPPPPLPRPPPPKKSKKMLGLEEKWEMELEDEVKGWWALTDEERQDWRRAKRDKELGFDD